MQQKFQVAVNLDPESFSRLKHQAAARNEPYGKVIAAALQALDTNASEGLAPLAGVYARLAIPDRQPWREKIRAMRRAGFWPVEIARRLHGEGLTSQYGTPLHVATIRNIVATGSRKSRPSN